MKILTKADIEANLPSLSALMAAIADGYCDYVRGQYDIPPVGYLALPHGELHLKYGRASASPYAVIKIAAGSYTNPGKGLPSSSGCLMVLDVETGFPLALLQDEGLLTDLRTSAAGAMMAKRFAPAAKTMGIVGCGIQGYYQTRDTCLALGINQVVAFDRKPASIASLAERLAPYDIAVTPASDIQSLCQQADIITTVTPSKEAYLDADWLKPGAHINAFGCDSLGKRELCGNVLERADLLLADSYDQCRDHGELQYAQEPVAERAVPFGQALAEGRNVSSAGLTVADYTGVAVQDIIIATLVYDACIGHVSP